METCLTCAVFVFIYMYGFMTIRKDKCIYSFPTVYINNSQHQSRSEVVSLGDCVIVVIIERHHAQQQREQVTHSPH